MFTQYSSFQTLRDLAQNPIDLTAKGTFSPKRLDEMQLATKDYFFSYAGQRVTSDVMRALYSLAGEAQVFDKMRAMQEGEVVNHIEGYESENRKVLHTAMRDFFDNRIEADSAKVATELAYKEFEKLKEFLETVDKGGYTDLVQIGIGGSELGPKAVYMALKAFSKEGRRVHFISNVDPDDAAAVLAPLDLKKTLAVVVSKSGGTLETRTNEELVREYFKKEGLDPVHHMVAVTGKGSPMDDPKKYMESFYMWDYVGGRYSATSMVGCVALGFALGMEKTLEFLRGAACMDKHALNAPKEENLPLHLALLGIWNRNFLGHMTCAVIPYSQAMVRFSAHLQQLDMESNGKRIDKSGVAVDHATGPVIWGEPGTNGQHSFYQLIHQGTNEVPVEFIGFRETQLDADIEFKGTTSQEKLLSNLFAQSIGLATGQANENPNKVFPGNRPNSLLCLKKCDPFAVGFLLSMYEHKVAYQGFIWNINSFDQEGVQLGKVLANEIIDVFAAVREDKAPSKGDSSLGSYLIEQMNRL